MAKQTNDEQQEPAKTQNKEQILNEIKNLEQRLSEVREREKRSLADYRNLQRRTQQERAKIIQRANKNLITDLLPVLENLENAADKLQDQGLDMVLRQFKQALQQTGLNEIKVMGQKFDVNTMEAVEADGKGQTVTQVLKKGYQLKDEVIQHAQVVLGQAQEEKQENESAAKTENLTNNKLDSAQSESVNNNNQDN